MNNKLPHSTSRPKGCGAAHLYKQQNMPFQFGCCWYCNNNTRLSAVSLGRFLSTEVMWLAIVLFRPLRPELHLSLCLHSAAGLLYPLNSLWGVLTRLYNCVQVQFPVLNIPSVWVVLCLCFVQLKGNTHIQVSVYMICDVTVSWQWIVDNAVMLSVRLSTPLPRFPHLLFVPMKVHAQDFCVSKFCSNNLTLSLCTLALINSPCKCADLTSLKTITQSFFFFNVSDKAAIV